MVTLNAWFSRNAQRPMLLLGVIFLGVQAMLISYHIAANEAERLVRIQNLVQKIGYTAIEQTNRDIIEATFTVAVEELGARHILLCKDNQVLISYPYAQAACRSHGGSWLDHEIELDASGYSGYKFIFLMPRWKLSTTFMAIVLITLTSIVFFFFILFRVQRKIKSDVLRPLEQHLFSEGKIEVAELEKLRQSVARIRQSDRDTAILTAKRESEAKFIHNIQSPLGLIKILKERLNSQLDPDSSKLFENVVSQISEITAIYADRTSAGSGSSAMLSERKEGLVDLSATITSCVDAKNMELTSRTIRSEIQFTDLASDRLPFVRASLGELRSIISNILNNAVDSGATHVALTLQVADQNAILDFEDNGSGVHESIRETLFERDVTYGKVHGTGFGLYHARKCLDRWQGSISLVESSESGSRFSIRLPLHQIPEIRIAAHSQIVILEDQDSERQRLKRQILSFAKGRTIKPIIELKSTGEAIDWFENTQVPISEIILFADNDLGDADCTGFHMIRELGIASLSYLVTNSYGSSELVSSCHSINLPIVPKPCVSNLQIAFT